MSTPTEVLDKIRAFAENNDKLHEERDKNPGDVDYRHYNRQLDHLLRGLQSQVELQEAALEELRLSKRVELPRPDLEPAARLAQTRRATAAYKALCQQEPELPAADSPLSGLLAIRETSRLVQELKSSIPATAESLAADRARQKTEEAHLRDAKAIEYGLGDRIKVLREVQRPGERDKNPSQLAKKRIQVLRKQQGEIEERTKGLKEALDAFIDEHLASMIAAEDAGGAVVGDQENVSDSVLEAGYTAHGKERKSKTSAGASTGSGQQRIDNLIRRRGDGAEGQGSMASNKREAAAAKMHVLLEALLEAAKSSSSYIELDRDSAAARFLVKAKIAQYHPRDSQRLRLIDFAREISD